MTNFFPLFYRERIKRTSVDNFVAVVIEPKVSCHHLKIYPKFVQHRQTWRASNPKWYQALKEEVEKLIANDFIKKAQYSTWISNPTLVKKHNEKWRVYIDFCNLNQARPKDSFPLPWIDQLKDAIVRNELLNFINASLGYNQISMHHENEEHISFIINKCICYYKVMPFRLKNDGAIY